MNNVRLNITKRSRPVRRGDALVPANNREVRKSESLDPQVNVIGWAWEDEALDAETGQRCCEVVPR